jgi:hypothetical protein
MSVKYIQEYNVGTSFREYMLGVYKRVYEKVDQSVRV